MQTIYLFLTVTLLALTTLRGFSQHADNTVVIKGYVIDRETLTDLSGVHVYSAKGRITVTDAKGFFQLKADRDDTITFSRVDYETRTIPLTDLETQDLVVTLQQKIYMLDTVDILSDYSVPSYLLKPERKPVYIEGITRTVDAEKSYRMGVGQSLQSPATAIYQLFSKRYKEEKKVHQLEIEEAKEEELKEKAYARIDEILELEKVKLFPDEYDSLVAHCKLNLEWVVNSNNYDLYLRMKDCLQTYVKKRGAEE